MQERMETDEFEKNEFLRLLTASAFEGENARTENRNYCSII